MTPIQRYQHLVTFWQGIAKERAAELDEALAERDKWKNKLAAAEIAIEIAKEQEQ